MKQLIIAFLATAAIAFAQVPDLGVQTKSPPEDLRKHLDLNASDGLQVTGVFADSDAERLGLKVGDIVTKLDKRPVKSTTGLANIVGAIYKVGDELTLTWIRKGRTMSGEITLKDSVTDVEFAKRYKASAAADSPEQQLAQQLEQQLGGLLGGLNLNDLVGGQGNAAGGAFMLGPDGKLVPLNNDELSKDMSDEERKQLEKALGGLNLDDAGGISIEMTTEFHSGGSVINHTAKQGGKHQFLIKDKDGEVEYQGTITAEQIDEIPEAHRKTATSLMQKNGIQNMLKNQGGGKNGSPEAEQNLQDLLKQLNGK